MYGYVTDRYWIDIGRVEKYIAGNKWFLENSLSPQVEIASHIEEIPPAGTHVAVGKECTIKKGARICNGTAIGDRVIVEAGAEISNSIIYPNTTIGDSCNISDSVIGDDVQLQEGVIIEKNVIIGKGCRIGAKAHIKSNSKVGPYFDVPPLASIEGVASSFVRKGSTMQLYLERNPELHEVSRDEVHIFGLLAEFGELPAKSLSRLSNISYSQIHKLLFNLQHRGLIVGYGETPRLFALRYEYPERLNFGSRQPEREEALNGRGHACSNGYSGV